MGRKHWHNLTGREKDEELARRAATRFPRRAYRCRYCHVVVDAPTREGHLGRCAAATAAGVTFARGVPLDDHYTEVAS